MPRWTNMVKSLLSKGRVFSVQIRGGVPNNKEKNMRYVKIAAPWLFRAYIVWSICADLFLVGLAVWYFFF